MNDTRCGLLMRNIGKAAFVPTVIAALMFAFLSFTFAVAKVLTYLLRDPRLGTLLATWAVITVATIVLLRRIPRLFKW
jgi:hypothetical protein